MSFEVTVTPTVYNVEVEVNPSVQPFDVVVEVGEVPNLSLTTNGDSGASTYVGGVLNIPEYTLDGLGGVPESRTITINGVEQDLSADISFSVSASTPVTIGSPANGLAIDGSQILTIGLASSSANGALSSTDWSTFNAKEPAIGFTPENVANKSTLTTLGTSDTLYPTQNAVKSYVDSKSIGAIGVTLDGQGGVVSIGTKGFVTVPYNCTINEWYLSANIIGSIVIDIKRSGLSIIGSGNKPTLSSSISSNSSANGWTSTSILAGDIIEWFVDSASIISNVTLTLKVTK
jgi:hypothetical protein